MTGEVVRQLAYVNLHRRFAKFHHPDGVALHVREDFACRAADAHRASAGGGEGRHGERHGDIVRQLEIDHLMIHHIVVHAVDAAAVIAARLVHPTGQGGADFFLRGVRRDHVDGPAVAAPAEALQVEAFCVVDAGVRRGAGIGAAFRRAGGLIFRREVGQMPEGGHPLGLLPGEPEEHVHIVAALGEDHRRGVRRNMPVAPHEGMGLMPVAHPLNALDVHDPPHLALLQQALDGLVEHGVAQHMADDDLAPLALRQLSDIAAFRNAAGRGLLQQQVIAEGQCVHRGPVVELIGGADEQHIRQPGRLQQAFHAVKAALRRDVIACRRCRDAVRADIRHSDQLGTVGVLFQTAGIGVQAAGAQARNGHGDLLHTHASFYFFFSLARLSLMMSICSAVTRVTPFSLAHFTQPLRTVGRKIRGTLSSFSQASSVNFTTSSARWAA